MIIGFSLFKEKNVAIGEGSEDKRGLLGMLIKRGKRFQVAHIQIDHVGKLNNKFSFLIFLTALKGMFLEKEKQRERFQDRANFLCQLHCTLGEEKKSTGRLPRCPLLCPPRPGGLSRVTSPWRQRVAALYSSHS